MEGDPRNPRVSLLKKYDIPIDHLTYEYVEKCNDKRELERIVRILRSGEEGSYPDLLNVTEEQLRKFAPDSRVLRVETPVLTKEALSSEEWSTIIEEVSSWVSEMKTCERILENEKKSMNTFDNKTMPEIRKVVPPTPKNPKQDSKTVTNKKNERIKSGDYSSWDKFDVDKELLKIDIEEERKEEENKKKKKEINKLVKETKIEMETVTKEAYSKVEQQVLATQAKDRGNECFKSKEFEKALKYYNISLNFHSSANAFNNRAMTYLKLNQYEKAIADCNKVLELERNNVKALHRRATAYQNLADKNNNFDELALQDLTKIIYLEPNNKIAQSDLQKLKKKLNIEYVGKKYRMPIYESELDSDKENISKEENKSPRNIKDEFISVDKLPLTYYGPSTSTFQCEPYSMTHRALSGSLSWHIICKCNSNVIRQNPLCQKCGEAMCKPSKKVKPKIENKSNGKKDNEEKNQMLKQQYNTEGKVEISNNESVNKLGKTEIVEIKPEKVDSANKSEGTLVLETENDRNKKENVIDGYKPIFQDEKGDRLKINKDYDVDTQSSESKEVEKNKIEVSDKLESNSDLLKENNKPDDKIDVNSSYVIHNKIKRNENNKVKNVDKNFELVTETNDSTSPDKNLTSDQSKICNKETLENVQSLQDVKHKNDDKKIIEPISCVQIVKHSSKKSKSKKKSKEFKETKLRRYVEPVKVVHAAKYLQPTTVEPKIKCESPEKPSPPQVDLSTSYKCKPFVPNKKCLSEKSLMYDSLRGNITSSADKKELENNQHNNVDVEKMRSDLIHEGNKENIIENTNVGNVEVHGKENVDLEPGKNSTLTPYQFLKNWEECKKVDDSCAMRAEIIRKMSPDEIKKVVGIHLDSEMLSCLLECLEKHFIDTEPEVVVEFLEQLSQLPRFELLVMFLGSEDIKIMIKLIETAERKGFKLDESVKKVFIKTS